MKKKNEKQISIYRFEEKESLGKGPFKLISIVVMPPKDSPAWENFLRENVSPVGTCAYCGTAITRNYIIKSSDGKINPIGSDCIGKLNCSKLTTEAKEAQKKLARDKRMEANRKKAEQAKQEAKLKFEEFIKSNPEILNDPSAKDAIEFRVKLGEYSQLYYFLTQTLPQEKRKAELKKFIHENISKLESLPHPWNWKGHTLASFYLYGESGMNELDLESYVKKIKEVL